MAIPAEQLESEKLFLLHGRVLGMTCAHLRLQLLLHELLERLQLLLPWLVAIVVAGERPYYKNKRKLKDVNMTTKCVIALSFEIV